MENIRITKDGIFITNNAKYLLVNDVRSAKQGILLSINDLIDNIKHKDIDSREQIKALMLCKQIINEWLDI
jgi:hypothetical protein